MWYSSRARGTKNIKSSERTPVPSTMWRVREKRWAESAVTPVSCNRDALQPSLPASHAAIGIERCSVHHLQDGRREHLGVRRQPGAGPVADSETARISDRTGDSPGRPDQSSRE